MELKDISLKDLSEEDLRELNRRVIAKIHSLAMDKVYRFNVGDPVYFEARGQVIHGTVKKLNRSTVSVTVNGYGPDWRVSPDLLRKEKINETV